MLVWRIWRIRLQFGCILHIEFDMSVFKGKARLLLHAKSQLKTFWTLHVKVVILDDELYQTTSYAIDERNRKGYIRNQILIESKIHVYINLIKSCYPHPIRYWIQIFKILSVLRHLFLSILIWGRKVRLLSKRRPKYFVSGTIFYRGIVLFLTPGLDGVLSCCKSAYQQFLSWRI